MARRLARKVMVVGMDGLMPEMVERFVAEGALPTMGRLIREGTFSPMLSAPPVDTPTNWTSLATGAWPGTHGVNSFCIHEHGQPWGVENYVRFRWNIFSRFPNRPPAYLNRFCQAEYIWQAAERAGKRCILVNWPGAWTPNIKRGIVVDGAGPLSSVFSRLAYPALAATPDGVPSGEQAIPLTVAPLPGTASPWTTRRPTLGAPLPLLPQQGGISRSPVYWLMVTSSGGQEYDSVLVYSDRKAEQPLAVLRSGEWSGWLHETFDSPHGPLPARFRLKLAALNGDGRGLVLRRSAIWYLEDWCYPAALAEELVDDAFAREELTDIAATGGHKTVSRVSPLCEVTESVEDQAMSIAATCAHLASHYDWDLFMAQIHAPDAINHDRLNGLCRDWAHYDPSKEQECWDAFRHEYRVLDTMLGEIMATTTEAAPVVIALSDHGCIPTARIAWVGKALLDAGLLVLKTDPVTGKLSTDTTRSRVILGDFPLAHNIWVNVKGRERDGIVEPGAEYEQVREETIRALYAMRDPETGRCPVALAMRTEEAGFLGPGGPTIGDLLYFCAAGYTPEFWMHSVGPFDPQLMPPCGFAPASGEVQGIHHAYLPTQEYMGCSVRATLMMAGPGIRAGHRLPRPPWTVDIAPTIAHLLGIEPPRTCEGSIIGGALAVG